LSGGIGNDYFNIDTDDIVFGSIDGGSGTDTAVLAATSLGVSIANLSLLSIENLSLASGGDSVSTGSTVGNRVTVQGMAGSDTLTGGDGNDHLDGGTENDTLLGGGGDDTLLGGSSGVDQLIGGDGNDIIYFDQNDVVDGGAGLRDAVMAMSAVTGFNLAATNIEIFGGSSGNDSADASGVTTNVTLNGGAGNDTLIGGSGNDGSDAGAGNDSVFGGSGNDTLFGGDGSDTLNGGDGDDWLQGASAFASSDTLIGGAGNDTLNGGGGIDYAYLSGNMADYDFSSITGPTVYTSGIQATHARNNSTTNDGIDLIALDTEFVVFGDGSTVARTALPLNTAPVLNANGGGLAYTENQAASAINSLLSVVDADTANLQGATVTISTGYVSGQDALGFTNQNGITGSFDSGTGVLTLSGSATVAQYQTALRSVTYVNTSDNPSGATRTISYQVNDGQSTNSASNVVTATVTVAPVNDAPVLTGDRAFTVAEGAAYTITAADIGYTDPDDVDAGVTFTVSSLTNGVVQVNGVTATSFTGTQLTAGQVTFLHNGSETTSASFNVSVEDGNEDVSTPVAQAVSVTVTPVNDAPTGFNFVADANTISSGNGTGNIGAGQLLGTFVAVDADSSGFTYSLSGTNAASFTIGASTGILSAGGAVLGAGTSYDINIVMSDGTASFSAPLHIEVLTTGANNYTGTAGEDLIFGLNNGDTLDGAGGNDVIMGGNAADQIAGGIGNDQIIGGADRDTMSGGTGSDIFIFGSTAEAGTTVGGADVISDFDPNQVGEFINVAFIDAQTGGGAPAGIQAFLFGGQNTSAVANSITWYQDVANNRTVIQGDVNGNTSADFFIVLTGIHTLSANDFILS
jgi:hypothetical protein